MSLQTQLEEIRDGLESRIPAPALDIMHQATAALISSGIEDKITAVGEAFPEFSLPNQDRDIVHSTPTFADGPVVITFYRGLWCPYCNADLAYIGALQSRIEEVGGKLLAISPQLSSYSQQVRSKNNLQFPILSDARNDLAAQLGLRFRLPDDLLALYRDQFGIDLPTFHGDDSRGPYPCPHVCDRSAGDYPLRRSKCRLYQAP